MRRKLSKKQIGAMGLAAMMAVQTPAMAAEVESSPETSVQETLPEETQSEVESQPVETETALETEPETQQTEEQEETAETTSDEMPEAESQEDVTEEIVTETETSEAETESEQAVDEYVLAENQKVLTDGWHKDNDGKYTYVKDGKLVKDQILEIDGKYYGFNYQGFMYVNEDFRTRGGYCRAKKFETKK